MYQLLIIRLLAIMLTTSFIGELTAYIHCDAVSIEIDGDNEEEENKEDKLKDCFFDFLVHSQNYVETSPPNSIYLIFFWNTPTIDSLTEPPELA